MAKIIKCPTCGASIPVTPEAIGQVVKCPGCGKGLKLKAKAPKPPGESLSNATSSGSISAMTFVGDAANPLDDPPPLESNCAVCGRPTAADDLVEDNGKLVCPDCIKGARSRIERTGEAAPIEFADTGTGAVRRGQIIKVSPMFIGGCAAALILGACQIYLNLFNRPGGTGTAHANVPGHAKVEPPTVEPAPAPPAPGEATTQGVALAPTTPAPATQGTAPTTPPPTTQTVAVAPAPAPVPPTPVTPDATVPPKTGSTVFPPPDSAPPAVAPVPITPPPAIVSNDPLEIGLDRLQAKDYRAAESAFNLARPKYLPNISALKNPLTPQQALILEGLAAAHLGNGRVEDARTRLNTAFKNGDHSRSLVLNRAIATVLSRVIPFDEVSVAAKDLKEYLDSHAGDEYAADIFGTMLDKAMAFPAVKKDAFDPFWKYLDDYDDAIAKEKVDQLKWGADWMPAEDVRRYRLLRGKETGIGVTQATHDLETAKSKLASAERNHQAAVAGKAAGQPVDVVGAKAQVDSAKANLELKQKDFEKASLLFKKPRWLDKFEPVVPEPVVATP